MKRPISSALCLLTLWLLLFPRPGIAAPDAPRDNTPRSAQYARQYIQFALQSCDRTEANLPRLTEVAQLIAERHLKGGSIGFPSNGQSLQQELAGRAGGLINFGFGGVWKKERSPEEKANDIGLIGWDRAPQPRELPMLQKLHEAGVYLIGFGPRDLPELAPYVALCDAWFDTGLGADDRMVELPGGARAGRGNALANMLNAWVLIGEFTSALTRHGKMPPFFKSNMLEDSAEWNARYRGQMQFHDDYNIAPIAAGTLGREYLDAMRANIRWFEATQLPGVEKAAGLIVSEVAQGRPVISALMGHAPDRYVGKYEDAAWSHPINLYNAPKILDKYRTGTPDGALVLRLGYTGLERPVADVLAEKKQRVLLITTANPRPEWQVPEDKMLVHIDMGWKFGDADLTSPGYPPRLLPPSGIMQIVAYESINVEVLAQLPKTAPAP
jgi:hypothetical protein